MSKQPHIGRRYAFVSITFALICVAFTVVLSFVLIKGPQTEYDPDAKNTRVDTVTGLRAEIYDRNGKLLVGNATTYNLLYEYGAMPNTYAEINSELLYILDAIRTVDTAEHMSEDYFPLRGVYPDMQYSSAVANDSSTEYYYLQRVLKRAGLDSAAEAKDLIKFLQKKYKLDDKLYTPEDITRLMRLWYEMERIDFGQYQSYTIAKNVSMDLVTYIQESGTMGATFTTVSTRVYEYPGVASHILGRLGKITAENADYYTALGYPLDAYVGISGCEAAFESILRGQDGKMVIKYDDNGNVIEKYYEIEPMSGNDVWLTIDIDLQIAAERGLAESAALTDTSKGGAITAIDTETGAVLAIASYPTYDLTQFSNADYYASLLENEDKPLINRALQGIYAPGSTYKIGVALAALEQGYTNDQYTCTCTGKYALLHQPACNGVHHSTDIFEAIQESCNIFFYDIGHRMGIDAITSYTKSLGLGEATGIELGESIGTVAGRQFREENKLDAWTAGDDISAAIGQSDHGYSPLQLSVYMASIVNGGTRFSAHILDSVRNFYTNEPITSYTPSVLSTVNISDHNYDILIRSMGQVVSENPEVKQYFKNVSVAVGGKTGTAEVNGQQDNALFPGFAPLNDPKIAVTCIIEEGQHGYYAAHAVAVVMEQYFSEKNP